MSDDDIAWVVEQSKGYSGADLKALCTESALGPIRLASVAISVSPFTICCPHRDIHDISNVSADHVRPIMLLDFRSALKQVRASVSEKDLSGYLAWNEQFGSFEAILHD